MNSVPGISKAALLLGVTLSLSLSTAGCRDNTESALAAAIHSCEVLTVAEVEDILGSSVEQPPRETHTETEDRGAWMSMCNYFAPDTGLSAGIMIKPVAPRLIDQPEAALEEYAREIRESLPDYTMQPVEGIAGKAVWDGATGQLTIFDRSHMYIISVMAREAGETKRLELAKKLAKAVQAETP